MKKEVSKESLLPPLWIITLLGVFGLWELLIELREIVMFLVVGYVAAYAIEPILDWLETKKVSRTIGFFLIITLIVLFFTIVFVTAIPPFIDDFNQFIEDVPSYSITVKARILDWIQWVSVHLPHGISIEQIKGNLLSIPDISGDTIKNVLIGVLHFLLKGYSVTLTAR